MANLKCWMRDLQVILTSSSQTITYGNEHQNNLPDLDITVTGSKYMSSLKDQFTVVIKNLTYKDILSLILGQFYDIEIKAGYRSIEGDPKTIFKGSVIYISNKKEDFKTNSVYILCGSKFVATYGQSRMNLTLSGNLNMYEAIKWVCKMSGITGSNVNIDSNFKKVFLKEVMSIQSTAPSLIETLTSSNNYLTSTDSTYDSILSLMSSTSTSNIINLTNQNILLVNGYPKVNSTGIEITTLPTYQFKPLDVITIDNSILDLGVTSYNTKSFTNSLYIDEDGEYMIYQIDYNLSNRKGDFNLTIYARARSYFTNLQGVLGYGN